MRDWRLLTMLVLILSYTSIFDHSGNKVITIENPLLEIKERFYGYFNF